MSTTVFMSVTLRLFHNFCESFYTRGFDSRLHPPESDALTHRDG